MIDQVDRQLADWVTNITGDVTVRFDMPGELPPGRGVVLYLLSFAPTPPASTGRVTPLQFTLRYLVTAWAESPPTVDSWHSRVTPATWLPEIQMDKRTCSSTIVKRRRRPASAFRRAARKRMRAAITESK